MKRTIEMKGKRFGRLTVVEFAYVDNRGESRWICQCDCGNTTNDTRGSQLRRGRAISCGCFRNEQSSIRASKHKKSNTRVYSIWSDMKKRCFNDQSKRYSDYGGRGITVCEEWRNNFEAFYDWAMSHGYSDNLSIDRIDVNGNYSPENCKWSTITEQNNNQRRNVLFEVNGQKHNISQWAKITGIKYSTLYSRVQRGHTGEDILKEVRKL